MTIEFDFRDQVAAASSGGTNYCNERDDLKKAEGSQDASINHSRVA